MDQRSESEGRHRRRVRRAAEVRSGLGPPWAIGAALAVVVAGSMLAVGAVHAVVILVVAACCIPLGVFAYLELTRARQSGWGTAAAVLAGLSLYSALQAIPLPAVLVRRLSPESFEIWQDSLRLLGESRSWLPLSIDPGASWLESAKWAAYFATFLAAVALARRFGPTWGALIVLASGTSAAVLATLHRAVGASALYGVYEPQLAVTPWRVAPLLNPNNFSGYLILTTFCGIGLLMMRRPPVPRAITFIATSGVVGILILTGSRGGVGAFLGGAILLVLLMLARARGGATPAWRVLAPLVGIVAFGVGLAWLAASAETWVALQDESLRKLSVVSNATRLIGDFWVTGVGRGAFDGAFPPYRPASGRVLFQYPENFIVQWLAEWGVLVGGAGLATLTWALRPHRVVKADSLTKALSVACVALLAQNLVDLGLEIMSVGLAFTTVLGTLVGRERARVDESRTQRGHSQQLAILGGVVGLSLVGLAAWRGSSSVIEERLTLGESYKTLDVASAGAVARFDEAVRSAVRRHPGDPYFPLLGALLARKTQRNAIPWLNRALDRDAQRGAAHLVLAEVLASRGAIGQAMLALRTAAEAQAELASRAAEAAAKWASTPEQLLAAVPAGAAGVSILLALANQENVGKLGPQVSRSELLQLAVARDPDNSRALLMDAQDLVKASEGGATAGGPCAGKDRDGCLQRLEADIRRLESGDRGGVEAAVLHAKLLRARAQPRQAEELLAVRCARLGGALPCLRARVEAALETADSRITSDAMTAYLAAACETPTLCASAAITLGDMCAERERWEDALVYYTRATQESPSRTAWSKLSRAAKQSGQKNRAHEAALRAEQSSQ